MYADREEEELRRRQRRRQSPSVSPVSRSVSRSVSPSRPSPPISRERELQEQLRRRALMSSKRSHETGSASRKTGEEDEQRLSPRKKSRRSSGSYRSISDDEDHSSRRSDSPSYDRRSSRRRDADAYYRRRESNDYNDHRYNSYSSRRRYRSPPPAHYYRQSPPARRHRQEDGPSTRRRTPDFENYEMRSIFCQQLAARLTQRDLGEFFEAKLGHGTVLDVRIVMDKVTGRSKGVGYVELKERSLVDQAIDLSGTALFGVPIVVQRTDAARNRAAAASAPGANFSSAEPHLTGEPIHIDASSLPNPSARLYVGNLNYSLGDAEIRSVFEPFGRITAIDLHREQVTLKSKGFAFVQFEDTEAAEKAILSMNGTELLGRTMKVNHVNAATKSTPATGETGYDQSAAFNAMEAAGATATLTSSFDEGGGGGLTASSRAALMEKLARIEPSSVKKDEEPPEQQRPTSIPEAISRGVLLKNMFNPEEEDERGWEKELADDIRDECEDKYGKVDAIRVDPMSSQGEVWVRFDDAKGAQKAVSGLNGRFFAGHSISASFVSEAFLTSMLSS